MFKDSLRCALIFVDTFVRKKYQKKRRYVGYIISTSIFSKIFCCTVYELCAVIFFYIFAVKFLTIISNTDRQKIREINVRNHNVYNVKIPSVMDVVILKW